MGKMLEIKVETKRIPLSRASIKALYRLRKYDVIAFTSKNARRFFAQELRKRRLALPRSVRVIQVGPRKDLLSFPLRGKRILFPRSALAPFDIVRRLRAKGAVVRAMTLYTAQGVILSHKQKELLLRGKITMLYFKSPSGIIGLLRQLSAREKRIVRALPATCIGPTTAEAARAAGFKNISIKGVL